MVRPNHRGLTPELLATIALVITYIVWILSLPSWPSQDGPIHLYYVHVIRELLWNPQAIYSRYYTIKHLLPPYALYYYLLLALSKFCSLLLADRIVLCVYFALFVFGFRYIAVKIGPSADLSTLLAVVLALNWSTGMGFLNHCLSLALVFWAIGVWLRFTERSLGARIIFLLLVMAITVTHPVPLLILLVFCAVDCLQRLVLRRTGSEDARRSWLRADLVLLGLSMLSLLYVRHFATASSIAQPSSIGGSYAGRVARHVRDTILLHHLALIFGHSPVILLYLGGLLALVVIAYTLAILQFRSNRTLRQWRASDTWLVYSVVLLVVIPLLPSDLNDAFYFTERLTILIWLAPLLAASGWAPHDRHDRAEERWARPVRVGLLIFAVAANLALLVEANGILRPLATEIAVATHAPVTNRGELGLLLEDSSAPLSVLKGPSWNPFYWAGAHVFRHDDAVLDNSPWLDAAIIPLGAQPALPIAATSAGNEASPHTLSVELEHSPAARARAFASVNFVLITQPGLAASSGVDPLLAHTPGGNAWSCRAGAAWLQLCEPTTGALNGSHP